MHLVRDLSYIYQKNYKEKVKKGEKKNYKEKDTKTCYYVKAHTNL
jgi:hypothetical protein